MRLLVFITILLFSASAINAQTLKKPAKGKAAKKGVASYYHEKFEGRKTATGDVFDNEKFTAASNKLKLGTYVKVTNLHNGNIAYVQVNDRMAPTNPRLIDLASVAAELLDFIENGIAKVKVEVVPEKEGKMGILAENEIRKIMRTEL
jgi:rare lipoprotein A